MTEPIIICPYVFDQEIEKVKQDYWELPFYFEKDVYRLGPDFMYQRMWNKFPDKDIIIFHSDIAHMPNENPTEWYHKLLRSVNGDYDAGMIGCQLLYPFTEDDKYYVQYAGGTFDDNGNPTHIGSGIDLFSKKQFKSELVEYDPSIKTLIPCQWLTFGALYIKRDLLNKIGNFDPRYEYSYNRDVEYCLRARKAGFRLVVDYSITLLHFESRDVKRIRNEEKVAAEARNLERLKKEWGETQYCRTNEEFYGDDFLPLKGSNYI